LFVHGEEKGKKEKCSFLEDIFVAILADSLSLHNAITGKISHSVLKGAELFSSILH